MAFATVKNQKFTVLSAACTNVATTIDVASATALGIPTLTGGNYHFITLISQGTWRQNPVTTPEVFEIIKVTAVSIAGGAGGTDRLTVTRAQDNTTGLAFSIGDYAEERPVAAHFNEITAAITSSGTALTAASLTLTAAAGYDTATVGSNLVDSSGWTSTNWTGSFGAGFDHNTGNTSALSRAVTYTTGQRYIVQFRIVGEASPAGLVTVSLGGSTSYTDGSSGGFGGAVSDKDFSVGFLAANNSDPVSFNPTSTFNGTISNITVKLVSAVRSAVITTKDLSGTAALEVRPSTNTFHDTFIGVNAGQYIAAEHTSGNSSSPLIAIGDNAMMNALTGKQAIAIGYNSQMSNANPDTDISIGYNSLKLATTGSYANVAIGNNAFPVLTTGYWNTGVGTDTGLSNTTGKFNCYLGVHAGLGNLTGNYNVAIGVNSLYNSTGTGNIGIGFSAGSVLSSGSSNTIIGYGNGITLTTGSNNLLIGTANFQGDVPTGVTSNYLNIGGAITGDLSTGNITVTGTVAASNLSGTNTGDQVLGSMSGVVLGANGGTGVANTSKTITLGGNLVTSGSFNTTLTVTADTNVTLPTTGTLLGTAAAVTVAQGGTGLASGTSGGIPAYTGTTTIASTALLAANAVMVGGGSGVVPKTQSNLTFDNTTLALTGAQTISSTLGVTGTATMGVINASAALSVSSDTGVNITNFRYTNDASGPSLSISKARGTQATPAAVSEASSGDNLGQITASGYHTTGTAGFTAAGLLRCRVDAAPSGDVVQGRWELLTKNAAGTLTLAQWWDSLQNTIIYGTVTAQSGIIENKALTAKTIASDATTCALTDRCLSLTAESIGVDNLGNITGGTDGQILMLTPASGQTITILNAGGGSGQIYTGTGASVALVANTEYRFRYTTSDTSWRRQL